MNNPDFANRPESLDNSRLQTVNKLKDIQNSIGRKYNPDQDEYWRLMKEKLEKFTDDKIEHLADLQNVMMEQREKVEELARSIQGDRFSEELRKSTNLKKQH